MKFSFEFFNKANRIQMKFFAGNAIYSILIYYLFLMIDNEIRKQLCVKHSLLGEENLIL